MKTKVGRKIKKENKTGCVSVTLQLDLIERIKKIAMMRNVSFSKQLNDTALFALNARQYAQMVREK